jgi:DNA-binding response OmpR family regulator
MTHKILIIDDDMTALDLMDIICERSGFTVIRQTDPEWVIDNIANIQPDIILIDIMMPKMTGDECIKRLRQNGVILPIVAFTAIADTLIHQDIMEKGASLVLAKPCKPDNLIAHLKRLLQTSGA